MKVRVGVIATALAVLLGAGTALGYTKSDITIAVLEFEHAGGDSEFGWFRSALPLMLAADLANLEGVTVLEREQVGPLLEELRLKEAGAVREQPPASGEKGADADVVVLGSFKQEDSQLSLNASLFDTATGEEVHLPGVTGDARDALTLEQELFHSVAGVLELDLTKVRRASQAPTVAGEVTLAVIPFLNISPAIGDISGDGLADLVAAKLSGVPAVRLVERERVREMLREFELSAAGLSEQTGKVVEAGKLLGARVMLLGSYATAGADIRIDARLVRVPSGEITNVMSVQGSRGDPAKAAERLALATAGRLQLGPDAGTKAQMEEKGTKSLEAYLYFSMAEDAGRLYLAATGLRNYQRMAYVDPDFRNVQLWVARGYHAVGNYTRALEVFEAYLPLYLEKGTVTWFWFLSIPQDCYKELGKFDDALALEETFKRVFSDAKFLSLQGAQTSGVRVKRILRAKEKAEAELARAADKAAEARKNLAEAKTDIEGYHAKLALAEAYKMWQKPKESVTAYQEALTSLPRSEDPREMRDFAFACFRFAEYCQARDRTEVARTYYLQAAEALEEYADAEKEPKPGTTAVAYDRAARCYGKLDGVARVRQLLRKAATAYATSEPWRGCIIAKGRLGDEELADSILQKALGHFQGDRPEDIVRRAEIYHSMKMRDQAAGEVERFIETYPDLDVYPSILARFMECSRTRRGEFIRAVVRQYFRHLDRANPRRCDVHKSYAAGMLSREIAIEQLNMERHKRLYVIGLILSDEFQDELPGVGTYFRKIGLYLRARDRGEERELNELLQDFRTAWDTLKENMVYSAFTPIRRSDVDPKRLELHERISSRRRQTGTGEEADTEEEFRSWLSQQIIPMIEGALERNRGDAALAKLLCKLYFLMGDAETSDNYFREALTAAPDKGTFFNTMAQFYEDERVTKRAEQIRLQLQSAAGGAQ